MTLGDEAGIRPVRSSTVARYAIGSIGTGGYATLPGLVLVYYLNDALGVSALIAGIGVTAAKVWDVIADPVIGARSDNEVTARGSRRRLMWIGAVALPVFFVLTFAVPASLPPWMSALWVFLAFLCAATAFSLFQVPYIALPYELAPAYHDRTRLLTARVVVLAVAILLFGAGGPALRSLGGEDVRFGYLVMAVVAAAVLGAALMSTIGVDRAVVQRSAGDAHRGTGYRAGLRALRESRPFRLLLATFLLQGLATGMMLAGAQYVATWVLRDEDAVTFLFVALIAPALLFAPLWSLVSRRIGKERAFAGASAMFGIAAASLIGLAWAPGDWAYLPVGLAGAGYAGMQALPMAMLPDVTDHDAGIRGTSRAGVFGGLWTAGETTGMALGATALTVILAVTGYVSSTAGADVVQPAGAILGVVLSFSLVPAALIALSMISLTRYPLRRTDIERIGRGRETNS